MLDAIVNMILWKIKIFCLKNVVGTVHSVSVGVCTVLPPLTPHPTQRHEAAEYPPRERRDRQTLRLRVRPRHEYQYASVDVYQSGQLSDVCSLDWNLIVAVISCTYYC